ncbi:MAG: acylneuraminate cytidylyltransferase family protein [Erysipelotrichales bacterium]|nr:acylneuraminate cytidylyltransferase family protein [Erysipelotrichales bacterium]
MLAIIPARGGSKGLPNKNIKLLNGKPLIAYTIEAALSSKYIDRVVVSTDSEEIAKISINYGAEVPFLRPSYLASDKSDALDTFIYTINKLYQSPNQISQFIILQPTSPLRNSNHIDSACELFFDKNADSVISVCKTKPLEWAILINNDSKLREALPTTLNNRQDFKDVYIPNGAIYILDWNKFKSQRKYYFDNTYPYIMDKISSIDIDDVDDFKLVSAVTKCLINDK